MKKYILMAAMAVITLSASAQKLEKPDIDKISGDTTYTVKEQMLANPFQVRGHYLGGNMVKGKRYYMIRFHVKEGLGDYYSVYKGDKAVIKFADGTIINIFATFDEHASMTGSGLAEMSESFLYYDLTDDDVKYLTEKKLAVVRIITSKDFYDFEIKDKHADVIQKQMLLLAGK
ncbi:MAG TPA: hypothetical protein VHA56_21745 [Mucilaginibacter sp.]|nr:hypothetical protein [Mucilaginibacter sp.]